MVLECHRIELSGRCSWIQGPALRLRLSSEDGAFLFAHLEMRPRVRRFTRVLVSHLLRDLDYRKLIFFSIWKDHIGKNLSIREVVFPTSEFHHPHNDHIHLHHKTAGFFQVLCPLNLDAIELSILSSLKTLTGPDSLFTHFPAFWIFIKILWGTALRDVRHCWMESEMIVFVSPYLVCKPCTQIIWEVPN